MEKISTAVAKKLFYSVLVDEKVSGHAKGSFAYITRSDIDQMDVTDICYLYHEPGLSDLEPAQDIIVVKHACEDGEEEVFAAVVA